jgi:lysophospholipase
VAKDAAGFSPTLVDVYGRLLSYQLLSPEAQDLSTDGAVTKTLSSVVSASNFTNHAVPFPIITSRGINTFQGKCMADLNATQYEFTPYDFGSWDAGVKAFTQTQYLGSRLTNGAPSVAGKCIKNYDNLGYVAGTTSDIFNSFCGAPAAKNNTQSLAQTLEAIVLNAHSPLTSDLYAPYPNPFYQSANSPLVSAQKTLQLADGGEGQANVPIWPLIQPERNLDVLIVSDNSADTSDNWPTGIALQTAYQQASLVNLTKMPFIPSTDVFISQGLNKRATFFGCGDNATVTIVYLPNNDYVYASNIGTVTIQTSKEETAGIIANGNQIVAQGGDEQWATCLGCAIVGKSGGALPEACGACFDKYCYKQ